MPALAIVQDSGSRSGPRPNPTLQSATVHHLGRTRRPLEKTHNWIPQTKGWYGYQWIDRDPELDFVLHCIEESGWTLEQIEAETEKTGHKVSRWTLLAWFYKGVKRPQNVTMNTVMAAIGWQREWKQRA
jgi:hypothetical protein